jgi:hypothetical protein
VATLQETERQVTGHCDEEVHKSIRVPWYLEEQFTQERHKNPNLPGLPPVCIARRSVDNVGGGESSGRRPPLYAVSCHGLSGEMVRNTSLPLRRGYESEFPRANLVSLRALSVWVTHMGQAIMRSASPRRLTCTIDNRGVQSLDIHRACDSASPDPV